MSHLQLQQAETFFFNKRQATALFFPLCVISEHLENLLVFVIFPTFLILKIPDVNSGFAGGRLCGGCTSCTLIELIREKGLNI